MNWQIWPGCFKIYRPSKISLALACWPWSFISPDDDALTSTSNRSLLLISPQLNPFTNYFLSSFIFPLKVLIPGGKRSCHYLEISSDFICANLGSKNSSDLSTFHIFTIFSIQALYLYKYVTSNDFKYIK